MVISWVVIYPSLGACHCPKIYWHEKYISIASILKRTSRVFYFCLVLEKNANLTNVELLLNQMSKQHLILRQQIEWSRQQLLDCVANIMIESSRPHSFTLERGPQEVNHVRYGVFRQCWYVCHPTLTDDLGSNSFQLQYQMSHANFELLLNIVSQHQVYEMASNNNSYPIEIQVATVLCFLVSVLDPIHSLPCGSLLPCQTILISL
ncbi:hypothetical protein J3Q64DRAFT_1693734 [Phycomyces blakesleeanus]|uniref:Uncharacterized protein n=1 Tax=Phycomyces blakesleeanus TaxID=4837 RepID=A0ABR3BEN4_PHYBL